MSNIRYPLIIFDTDCTFCSHFAQFVLGHERTETFFFTSLTGETAQAFFTRHNITDTEAIWLIHSEDEYYAKSSATLRIFRKLSWPWSWAPVFLIVPRIIRDAVYDFIAARRKRIMKGQTCPVWPDEQSHRLLP